MSKTPVLYHIDCGNCSDTLPAGWDSSRCGGCDYFGGYICHDGSQKFEQYQYCFQDAESYQLVSKEKIRDYCKCSCDNCGNHMSCSVIEFSLCQFFLLLIKRKRYYKCLLKSCLILR